MAKFYLHMLAGDTLGKVTKLRYIDDISDDELIIYVFEDNTKCDETYIAEMNSMDAFNGRFVMAEVTDPTNIWKFETKEFNLDKTRTVSDPMGNVFELPEPGIGRNGEHVSLSFSEDGTPMARSITTAGKRTDATPPRIYKNKKIEPKEDYLLSLHPELLTGEVTRNKQKTDETKNMNFSQTTHVPTITSTTPVPKLQIQTSAPNVMSSYNPISTNIIETVRHANININLDDMLNSTEYQKITITYQGKQTDLDILDFVLRLTSEKYVQNKEDDESTVISPFDDPSYKEDILITNMIEKSKKKVYTIGVDIELELPPKEVYKTIKDVYPDGMALHFVTSISRRMNCHTLKEALSTGLTAYYEGANNE